MLKMCHKYQLSIVLLTSFLKTDGYVDVEYIAYTEFKQTMNLPNNFLHKQLHNQTLGPERSMSHSL